MLVSSDRIVVRSDTDSHVLFSVFKVYYPYADKAEARYILHHHPELEISCILDGAGIYHCAGNDYPFSAGDVFFHRSNDVHYAKTLDTPDGKIPRLLVIRFAPRFIWSPGGEWFNSKYLQLFTQQNSIRRMIPHGERAAQIIVSLLAEIFEECRGQEPSYDLLVKAKLMTILANMARYYYRELEAEDAPGINQRHLEQMERSTSFILSHLGEDLTLEDLAHEACMSRSYYSTVFKSLNGLSVWEYITRQRIDLAQYQLETTANSVLQISEACGFNSIANFNRSFKKLTGKTPTEYRKSIAASHRDREETP